MTPNPSIERTSKGRFAPSGLPLISNVRSREVAVRGTRGASLAIA